MTQGQKLANAYFANGYFENPRKVPRTPQLHSSQKRFIHRLMFSELISRKFTFQLQEDIDRGSISRKLHITYSFVIQRITWKTCLGITFLENLILVTRNNASGINFAIISGWSVRKRKGGKGWTSDKNRRPANLLKNVRLSSHCNSLASPYP